MVCTTAARVLVCRVGAIYRGSRDTDLEMEGRIRTGRGGGEQGVDLREGTSSFARLTDLVCQRHKIWGFQRACGGASMDRNSAAQRMSGQGRGSCSARTLEPRSPDSLELTIPNPAGQAVQGLTWGRLLQQLRNRRPKGIPRGHPCAITSIGTS